MNSDLPSELYYYGTKTRVHLGDRVSFKTLLSRRTKLATVACIPERTGRQLATEGQQPDNWLLRFDDGTITGWIYSPEDLQPTKRLTFIGRGDPDFRGISNKELEELEKKEEHATTWLELFISAVFQLLFMFGAAALVLYLWKFLRHLWRSYV
jgi:hypothetical protein